MMNRSEAKRFIIKKIVMSEVIKKINEGSSSSGNYGHKGRSRRRGGSMPGGGHITLGKKMAHAKSIGAFSEAATSLAFFQRFCLQLWELGLDFK